MNIEKQSILTSSEKKVLNNLFNSLKIRYGHYNYKPLYVIFQLSNQPDIYKEMLYKATLDGREVGAKVIFDKASGLNDGSKEVFKNVELGKKYKLEDLDLEV